MLRYFHFLFGGTKEEKERKKETYLNLLIRWFMPVNIGLTFLLGGILGWILVKILKPKPFLEGVIIATCSAGINTLTKTWHIIYSYMMITLSWLNPESSENVFVLGNLGNLPLIIIPAICNESGSPFGDRETCSSVGISYASFSMAVIYGVFQTN